MPFNILILLPVNSHSETDKSWSTCMTLKNDSGTDDPKTGD